MIPYFIGLLPSSEMRAEVAEAKLKIVERNGIQTYLCDPAHSTLYVGLTEDLEVIKGIVKQMPTNAISVNAEDWLTFAEPIGFTEGVQVNNNPAIFSLQDQLVEKINAVRKGAVHERYTKSWPGPLQYSVDNYGYPFYKGEDGKHILIPHVSFASFEKEEDALAFRDEFKPKFVGKEFMYDKLALYTIYDDKCEKIFEVDLK